MLHGAIQKNVTLPMFDGKGITALSGANRIFISDPTLYLTDECGLRGIWAHESSRI